MVTFIEFKIEVEEISYFPEYRRLVLVLSGGIKAIIDLLCEVFIMVGSWNTIIFSSIQVYH